MTGLEVLVAICALIVGFFAGVGIVAFIEWMRYR